MQFCGREIGLTALAGTVGAIATIIGAIWAIPVGASVIFEYIRQPVYAELKREELREDQNREQFLSFWITSDERERYSILAGIGKRDQSVQEFEQLQRIENDINTHTKERDNLRIKLYNFSDGV